MAKKTITKEHPITAFRKANEARQAVVNKSLPKAQDGRQVSKMIDYNNLYSGPDSTNPGVLKAKADKAKMDALLLSIKNKADLQKVIAVKKVKKAKKK